MTSLAELAMVGTLPDRAQGLGLVVESLIKDLRMGRVGFAVMNLWATVFGSLFCLWFESLGFCPALEGGESAAARTVLFGRPRRAVAESARARIVRS